MNVPAKVPGHLTAIEPGIPAPKTLAEAISQMHGSAIATETAMDQLLELVSRREENPQLRMVAINDANNGQYQVTVKFRRLAKSLGILNPGAAPVFIGVGGGSATALGRAPSCPGNAAETLPLQGYEFNIGCDPTTLGAATAVVFLFRYETVQPLMLRQVP